MKLSQLIRKREVATVTVATPATVIPINSSSVATVASVNVANEKTATVALPELMDTATAWRWLLHYPGHDVEVSTSPGSTLAEMLRDFPGAITAEPIPDTPKRKPTFSEIRELTVLVNKIYANDTEADRAEALEAALADPDGALTCYRAIIAERAGI